MALFRRRLTGMSIAIVLGLAGLGALPGPAQAADPTTPVSSSGADQSAIGALTLTGFTGVGDWNSTTQSYASNVIQVGDTLEATVAQDGTSPQDSPVTVQWFCGTTSLATTQAYLDEYATDPSASYVVQPKDVGCVITAKASISAAGQTISTAASVPVTVQALALGEGYVYPNYPLTPYWGLLKGYDASAQTLGTEVVTNWGTTTLTGVTCSVAPAQSGSSTVATTIVKQPAASLAAQAATTVQLLPAAGLPVGSYQDQLTCQDSTGSVVSDGNISVDVVATPELDLFTDQGQIGDTLQAFASPIPSDAAVSNYQWVCLDDKGNASKAANDQGTDSYTVTSADIGCNLAVRAAITVSGYAPVTGQSDPSPVGSIAISGDLEWNTSVGYDPTAVSPATKDVVLTNEGSQAVTNLAFVLSDSHIVQSVALPASATLAAGASVTVPVGFPSTPLGPGDHAIPLGLTYSVGGVDYSDNIYTMVKVDDGIPPIEPIQPTDGTVTRPADEPPAPGDTASSGSTPGGTTSGGTTPGGSTSGSGSSTPGSGTTTSAGSSAAAHGTVSVSTGGSTVSTRSGAATVFGALALVAVGVALLRRRTI